MEESGESAKAPDPETGPVTDMDTSETPPESENKDQSPSKRSRSQENLSEQPPASKKKAMNSSHPLEDNQKDDLVSNEL